MQRCPLLSLVSGLLLWACDSTVGPPPSSTGTLVVSTTTSGEDPDPDGYLLAVDDADFLGLSSTGSVELELAPGRHTLRLLGVAGHCSVAPGTPIEVNIASGSTTPVAFDISCLATGIRVTAPTTGLDLDPSGYHVAVDSTDRGIVAASGTLFVRVEPGSRTVVLTSLAPNCAVDGPGWRTVIITRGQVAPVEFAVVCTATTGVIELMIEAGGTDVEGRYEAMVDEVSYPFDGPGGPQYLAGVSAGSHVVSLVPPPNCSTSTDSQSVTVSGGSLVRDTVQAVFSVTCRQGFGTLRITAHTSGPIPARNYTVWICDFGDSYYCSYSDHTRLGSLAPNGTLVARADPGVHRLWLQDLPPNCSARNASPFNPTPPFTVANGDSINFNLQVYC